MRLPAALLFSCVLSFDLVIPLLGIVLLCELAPFANCCCSFAAVLCRPQVLLLTGASLLSTFLLQQIPNLSGDIARSQLLPLSFCHESL